MKKRKSNSSSGGDAVVNKRAGEVGRQDPPATKVVVAAEEVVDQYCTLRAPAVEEQMWWGAEWYPAFDVASMGEAYITSLYSDVWGHGYDDIWCFRNSDQLSTPPPP